MHHMLPSQCHSVSTSKVLPKSIFECSSSVQVEESEVVDAEEGAVQKVQESAPVKTVKDQKAKSETDSKKSRFAAKQAKQKLIRDLKNHPMFAPLVTLAILIAHLFSFRQFSFALIEL
jgi:hypothetical protein